MSELLISQKGDDEDVVLKERLIANVKREVKRLMEESITKKSVPEESGSVVALCNAVEACLSHGLRRRALGLFRSSSTTALVQRIAKFCPEAEFVNQRLLELELAVVVDQESGKRCYSSSSDSILKPKIFLNKERSSGSVSSVIPTLGVRNSHSLSTKSNNNNIDSRSSTRLRYLWIRLALSEQKLSKIIEYLVENAHNYYEPEALIADPDYGGILSSLLIGPCALHYTKSITNHHLWSDPLRDELMPGHRIDSGNRSPPTGYQKPLINFKRCLNTNSEDICSSTLRSTSLASLAKDNMESLHQNTHAILLYGKNNVLMLPKGSTEPMNGYLSLHQSAQSLIIKWTPNELMNGNGSGNSVNLCGIANEGSTMDSVNNDGRLYALNINVNEIVYVHCHQNSGEETGGTIILVGQDGVQQPPIHFPEGGHMQAFLNCLETALLPTGQLDPPLWSQRSISQIFAWSKNSMRKRLLPAKKGHTTQLTPTDYVFRVVNRSHPPDEYSSHSIWELVGGRQNCKRQHLSSCSTTGSSDCSSKSLSLEQITTDSPLRFITQSSSSIELVCSTMRRRIISRAFYGWLAYYRHLSTVRTHLSGLVNGCLPAEMTPESDTGLTRLKWESWKDIVDNQDLVYRLVYFGGVAPEIRAEVWPYLLGHYSFGSTPEERKDLDASTKLYYETKMSEWLAVEAIVKQREEEKTAKALAKIAHEQQQRFNGSEDTSTRKRESLDVEVGNISDLSDLSVDTEEEEEKEEEQEEEEDVTKKQHDARQMENRNLLNLEWERQRMKTETNGIHLRSMKSSPSTSSYETVANEFPIGMEDDRTPIYSLEKIITEQLEEKQVEGEMEMMGSYHSVENLQVMDESTMETVESGKKELISITLKAVVETTPRNSLISSSLTEEPTVVASSLDTPPQDQISISISTCPSPVSSNGGIYTLELLENFALNLHRIEKDVLRCDRNYWYFANENLEKLRNVITTYVWEHLDIGYMQGMCDLVAPLLVIFDDESLTFGCFTKLMERMIDNFPNGGAMDMHFTNMRSLIQILDPEMYDVMDSSGDYTHFYFCYRWFLLDFKREFVYDDVFAIWEVIWAGHHIAGNHFVLFLALALLETYRDIILSNSMDFIDVIKFFNEMAERHNAKAILELARNLVSQLQTIIESK